MNTPNQPYGDTQNITAEAVLRYVEPVQPETEPEKIFFRFSENKSLSAIPVVKQGRPVGLIHRNEFLHYIAQSSHCELTGNNTCSDMTNTGTLLVDKSTPILELSGYLSESEIRHFTDGFIITEQGHYIGIGTGQDLLRQITKTQIETAQHTQPLTSLPGNVPINAHIEQLLQSGKTFTVCYADLDNLKPFNEAFGYKKGDEAIQFTGKLLGKACDPVQDFIGHTGGDDFILVMQSKDWKQRCHRTLHVFAQTFAAILDAKHHTIGGYSTEDRQGRIERHPLPTLSIGVIQVAPELFTSHHEVAEAAITAKVMAQKKTGNSLFIERRRLHKREVINGQHAGAELHYG